MVHEVEGGLRAIDAGIRGVRARLFEFTSAPWSSVRKPRPKPAAWEHLRKGGVPRSQRVHGRSA